jgi:hypothetical protein
MLADPVWTLNQLCPVCEQGSSLTFNTCKKCNELILICDEENTLFPNPKDLTKREGWIGTCPHCKVFYCLRFSTSEEIQRLGFNVDEYI